MLRSFVFWRGTETEMSDKSGDILLCAVRAAREAQGVTQQQLADAAGCSLRSVSEWLNGRNPNISAASVSAMLEVLGLEIVRIHDSSAKSG